MKVDPARAFLDHIIAHPDDDAPRLVYADWLDERGETARAEFIRVQIERAALPAWDARQVPLWLRERALLDQHGTSWKKELPRLAGVTWGGSRRGFVATAAFATFAVFGKKVAACGAATPLEGVTVGWPREEDNSAALTPPAGLRELTVTETNVDPHDVERLANAPLLAGLRTLTVRECGLGVEGFRRLVASPHLKGLTALRVPFNSVGTGGVSALHRVATMPALTELDLSEAGSYGRYAEEPIVDATGMQALAAWPGLARLRTLTLNGNDVGREGLRALVRSPLAVSLKALALRGNSFTEQAVAEFGDARSGLQLDSLDLGENLLRELGPAYLARSSCLRGLKDLRIDRCEVPGMGAHELAQGPFIGGLRRLDASHNGFGPLGLLALLVKSPAELHTLRLVNNDLGDDGVNRLVGSAAANSLRWLDLEQNGLTAAAALALGGSPHLRNLLALRLTDNPISPAAVRALRTSALGRRLALLEVPGEGPVAGGDDLPF